MNTNITIAIIAGLVVVGGGYYVMNGSATGMSSENAEQTSEQAEAGVYTGSLYDLAQRGGEWKCTVDSKATTGVGEAMSSGTVYVSGNNVRADFTSTVPNFGSIESHMIVSGEYAYTWSSVMPQGIKTNVNMKDSPSQVATSGASSDANQEYSYDCDPAQADVSLFVVPTTVTFTTM